MQALFSSCFVVFVCVCFLVVVLFVLSLHSVAFVCFVGVLNVAVFLFVAFCGGILSWLSFMVVGGVVTTVILVDSWMCLCHIGSFL